MTGLGFDPIILLIFPIILFSLSVHECAHAITALWGGDDTARLQGRITLNPISHIDVIGTILVPLALAVAGAPVLGWARPVQINPMRLKRDYWNAIVAAAGPASNLLLAIICTLLAAIAARVYPVAQWPEGVMQFVWLFIRTNVLLAIFNLLPVPPLDGSKIFFHYFINGRPQFYPAWQALESMSFILLYLFIQLPPVRSFVIWTTEGLFLPMRHLIGF